MFVDVLLLLGGIALVVFSADRMVLASADLAARWGVSAVVVGAVIIGFGGQSLVVKREGGLMLAALVLSSVFVWDGALQIHEGAVLLTALIASGIAVVSWSNGEDPGNGQQGATDKPAWLNAIIVVLALAALVAGARGMVVGAENIALEIGMSEGVVGLTILALGTSLPELGTVIASARRGRNDLVLGNILGSNVFNALGVVGAVGIVGPGALVTNFQPDLIVMVLVAVLAGVIAWSGDRLRRVEGVLLLAAYPVAIVLAL